MSGPEIERLVQLLAKLPGLGRRSARKAALALVKRKDDLMLPLAEALQTAAERLVTCPICANIDTTAPCNICVDPRRDPSLLVVVEDIQDLWALERAGATRGRYHVLGGHLSPLDAIGPEQLNIPRLVERASDPEVREVLLALNVTVEGQATAHYLTDALSDAEVTVSRIAQGVPIGGELDYLDDGTLAAAVRSRRSV
ncbi:MAG: recombination mediator RecR [Hyphomicrobiaceae bacterium]